MSDDLFRELAPLAALDALDGEERDRFEAHETTCVTCQDETLAFRRVAALLALALERVPPAPSLRLRVLGPTSSETRSQGGMVLALAAALLIALGLLGTVWRERNAAVRERLMSRALVAAAQDEALKASRDLALLQEHFGREAAFQALASAPDSRMIHLSGKTPSGPGACIVWNAATGEAVLMASGLGQAPKDKMYEVWVIAEAPVPAGLFQTDASGKAFFKLPAVSAISRVKTFAVTIEPAVGTSSPTGPIVLSGTAS
jgi:hypothetical protein